MTTYDDEFRAAVRAAIAPPFFHADAAVEAIMAAATIWADEREADQPAPDGSEGCMGPCCGGTP
jgi:hypothetical protein